MKRGKTGEYRIISTVGNETCKAFIPNALPPDPPICMDAAIQSRLEKALVALGRLDSVSTLLPDSSLFLYMYIRKEAVLSSQIEGKQSSLSDLLRWESKAAPGVPIDDVREVSNYVAAMDHGLKLLREGLPISLRLIREIHGVLLGSGRGADKSPGEFRRTQNWLGGAGPGNARFVPPPADSVTSLMGDLENFLHDISSGLPILIKAALAHVQFETVHPFLDGNGRVGRLLITLLLCAQHMLTEPTLYLSLYFKSKRDAYYELLQRTRTEGDWEAWLEFFLEGVEVTANQAVQTAKKLVDIFASDEKRIQQLGKAAGSAIRVHNVLQRVPILTVARATELTGVSSPTATSALNRLERMGIVQQLPKIGRAKVFSYLQYLSVLNEGTERI